MLARRLPAQPAVSASWHRSVVSGSGRLAAGAEERHRRRRPQPVARARAPEAAAPADAAPEAAPRPANGGADPSSAEAVAATPAGAEQFDWYKQWYPLAAEVDLDRAAPSHARLLGEDLVLWWDRAAEQWRCFLDRCPHRLAPLSEGRIDRGSGRLVCNYHGWAFQGCGRCAAVPQLDGQGPPPSSSRSRATSFPTRAAEGLVWVWADAGPTAAADSAAADAWPGLAPEVTERGDAAFSSAFPAHRWYVRDVPVAWIAARENSYNDPSHDFCLHHGASKALDRAKAAPLFTRLAQMTPTGYVIRDDRYGFTDTARFPCGSRRDSPSHVGLAYVTPTGVGTCRQFHAFLEPAGAGAAPARGGRVAAALRWRPAWASHLFSHTVIDADVAMQSRVDVNRARDGRVYMPAAADAGPAALRRWLDAHGGGGPPVAKLRAPFVGATPSVPDDRRQLLDRLRQHTCICRSCSAAHRRLSAAAAAAAAAALMFGAAALAVGALLLAGGGGGAAAAGSAGGRTALALGAAAALAAALHWRLSRLVQAFVFVDYDSHHVSKQ